MCKVSSLRFLVSTDFDPPGLGSRQALARLSLAEEEEKVFYLQKENVTKDKTGQTDRQTGR